MENNRIADLVVVLRDLVGQQNVADNPVDRFVDEIVRENAVQILM